MSSDAPPPEAPPQYAPPPVDPADELKHLAQLHTSGALTDEEFASAKASVLGVGGREILPVDGHGFPR